MIKFNNDGTIQYFDKNGTEITKGCRILFPNGRIERVYLTQDGELGWDATNPNWIARGWAAPCQYGIYPLTNQDTSVVEVIK
jgi:hypothetical protein